MKTFYLCPKVNLFTIISKYLAVSILALMVGFSVTAQGLVFNNNTRESGAEGEDGTIYRFSNVTSNIDALVKINGRSSSQVKLASIDRADIGHGKAFQPQVSYGNNNTTPSGISDWWMEFSISFVTHGTLVSVPVSSFNVTALDIDGNGDKINEYVCMYNLETFTLEAASDLNVSAISELVTGVMTITGKKFEGPVKNYVDIDTSATELMTTNNYKNKNTFRLRTGGHSTGISGASDRLYSFWFKTFTYEAPVTASLPLTLVGWEARLNDNNVILNWATDMQKNTSHFVIERSTDGLNYNEAALLFAEGNSNKYTEYSYTDKLAAGSTGVLFYRLRMVDIDGMYKYSPVRTIKLGKTAANISLATYPNPVQNELRVTVPASWQNKRVVYEVFNSNGQALKKIVSARSSQTENIAFHDLSAGVYVVKVSCDAEVAVKQILKVK